MPTAGDAAVANDPWLAEVQRRWPASRIARVAALLGVLARERGSGMVTLDATAVRHLLLQAHALPPGLRQILHRLVAGGLLAHTPSEDPAGWGTYALTMPTGRTAPPSPGEPTENGDRR